MELLLLYFRVTHVLVTIKLGACGLGEESFRFNNHAINGQDWFRTKCLVWNPAQNSLEIHFWSSMI